jgi:prefoldin beta subunit
MEISPEMQHQIRELQEADQQARIVLSQKYQIELQIKEMQRALDELGKDAKAEVHRVVGQILIKSDAKTTSAELKEKIEALDVRLKTLEKQEGKIKEKVKSLQDRLQGVIPSAGG